MNIRETFVKNRQFILLLILLFVVFVLTSIVIKFYTPTNILDRDEAVSLNERLEIQTLIGQAYFAYSQNEYSAAERILYRLLEKDANNTVALQMLGNIYFLKKDYSKAADMLTKLLALNINTTLIYNNLGQAYMLDYKYQKAINAFQLSLEVNKNQVMPYLHLAELYIIIKDKKLAIDNLSEAFKYARKQNMFIFNLSKFKSLEGEKAYQDLIQRELNLYLHKDEATTNE